MILDLKKSEYKGKRELSLKNREQILKEEGTKDCIFLFQVKRVLYDKPYLQGCFEDIEEWTTEKFTEESEIHGLYENILIDYDTLMIFGTRDEAYFFGEKYFDREYRIYGYPCISPLLAKYLNKKWDAFIENEKIDLVKKTDECVIFALYYSSYYYYLQTMINNGYNNDDNYCFYKIDDDREEKYYYNNEELVNLCFAEKYYKFDGLFLTKDNALNFGKRNAYHYDDYTIGKISCKGKLAKFINMIKENKITLE